MSTDEFKFEVRDQVAYLTLNRPERGNALTPDIHRAAREYWAEIRDNPEIRCTIITGTGEKHFCTGVDVGVVAGRGRVSAGRGPLTEEVRYSSRQNKVWKPTICAVNGLVAGGGLHFVVDADIVLAADHATFVDTHVDVGMVGGIENIGLAKRLPLGTALRMTLQGRAFRLTAQRAYQLGLVDELMPLAGLMETAEKIARDIKKTSPTASSLSQQAIWASLDLGYEQAEEYGWSLVRMHWGHPDFKEGPKAFAEKRQARWEPLGS